ncbi:MAG TPA: metal-dependent hydrolase [Anaerolineae bacterium]|nr:metal-dependent hydrolase [Caldilineae bacterium]HID34649.1 metal-dependent hydrolase [Anaerolineae bacterium]HIQ12715.1 metal-dependent hydrolase [Caldilineales bacterium]
MTQPVKVTFHGHATISIESDGHKILIDPFFSGNPAAKIGPDDVAPDFILISHGHGDHVGDAVSIAQRTGALVISNFEIVSWLGNHGVEKTHPLHIGGGNTFPFGYCKMTVAHHGSSLPDGTYGGDPGGFLLKLNSGKTIYFAGDTALVAEMKFLADEKVDLAILPVGDNFTMGPDDAIKAAQLIKPVTVLPIHYNTWPYIEIDIDALKKRMIKEADVGVAVLQPEETFIVP